MEAEMAENPVVALDGLGELQGDFCPGSSDVLRFLDVPYAAPPVGDMRWRQPAQPEPWEGVRTNPHVLTRCPQPSMRGPPPTFAGHTLVDDEDCLKCAIWAPVAAVQAAAEAEELAQIAAIEAAEDEAERLERGAVDPNYPDDPDDPTRREHAYPDQRPPGSAGGMPGGNVPELGSRAEPTAAATTAHLLPVIVYIHGGGGKLGSCHTDVHGGETLARTQSVVFVAINYRLGILGFLAHPALSSEDRGSPIACCGNYAIADQIAALTWLQQHVHSFGGDKRNITLMGYSSGAQFVSTLIVSPPTRHPQWGMGADSRPTGLFHRAVVQSCVDLPNVRKLQSSCDIWLGKSAEEWGEELAEGMGCPTEEDAELADSWHSGQLASLRKLPIETILEHTFDDAATDCYESVIDARGARWGGALACLKPVSSLEALETGAFHRVPLMVGATEQDGLGKGELELVMFDSTDVTDLPGLRALFQKAFGEARAEEALALYYYPPPAEAEAMGEAAAVEAALGRLGGELWYQGGSWHMANTVSAAAAAPPVWLYSFTERVFAGQGQPPRSYHGSDVAFWHGSTSDVPEHTHPDPARTRLGASMLSYLGNFARTGDPNDAGNGGEGLQLITAGAGGAAAAAAAASSRGGGSEGGDGAASALPQWAPHTPRAEQLMALGSSSSDSSSGGGGSSTSAEDDEGGIGMRPLGLETAGRFALLADEYFGKLVPRQLAAGQQQGGPAQAAAQQMARRRGGGWTGRRRQRL